MATQTPKKYTSIGGQAVLEGVMMRSPRFIAIAIRKPDGKIAVKSYAHDSVSARYPILRKPVLRGVVGLVESMVQGIHALGYSAEVAAEAEKLAGKQEGKKEQELSKLAIAGSMIAAFAMAIGLFVALPHLLTVLLTKNQVSVDSPLFHVIDGTFNLIILMAYVYAISLMKDIRRVFQYHGAEHKSIYAFEAGETLTVENAARHTALHPRCGTSFLLFLVLISIAVFSIIFPLLGLTRFTDNVIVNHAVMIVVKIALMFPVAGVSYEFIKACACRMDNPVFRAMIWPGMILQNLTTRPPENDQLEVALVSLRQVLKLEKAHAAATAVLTAVAASAPAEAASEFIVGSLDEINEVRATVSEFPEGA